MRLFHFSEDAAIARFVPRAVRVPAERAPGREWLNGPLVWAIDEDHQSMYLFPRECPRILLWAAPGSTDADVALWLGGPRTQRVACIEYAWLERLRQAEVSRYELPPERFEALDDAGMWVSREAVVPIGHAVVGDLPSRLAECGTALRVMDSLLPLRAAWDSTLHVSGIRLRNARGWNPAAVR
jgi:hypothetical protein